MSEPRPIITRCLGSWRSAVAAVALGIFVVVGMGAERAASRSAPVGGTLRVAAPTDLPSLDPALARPLANATWYATCATLTVFRDAGAPAGLTTRPEAAAGPPRVSPDGRTYVFTVRRGLRFSDGSRLTAANFARALGRVLDPTMQSYGASLFADVKRVDANGERLVIGRRRPGGALTTRLALPFACPVPLGFPVAPGGVPLMVGSGPYYTARHDPDQLLVLERNPYYRGSRPHYVDRVVITVGGDLDAD